MDREEGFSATALERCNRIKSFVFPRSCEMAQNEELVTRLKSLYAARYEFVKASSKFEGELSRVDGFLKKSYNDWSNYEAIMEGLDEMRDAIGEQWFWGR